MGNRFPVSPGFCLVMAMMLLIVPLPWLCAIVFAAGFHELCHYLAIRLCGRHTQALHVNALGAQMVLPEMGRGQELLCTLAGPAGSLLLCLLLRWFPRVAICAAAHVVFNLLPVYPLDGGRALRCILTVVVSPPTAVRILRIIEWAVCIVICGLGLYAWLVLQAGLLSLLPGVLVFFRCISGKIPCKPGRLGVQ